MQNGAKLPRVVIVGGGFGGLYAAQALRRAPVHVTLLDKRNFHLFQPLLYQAATGGLSPADIASPLRAVLNRQKNVRVLQAEVVDFDVEHQKVLCKDSSFGYDTLIVATGVQHSYFGNDAWEPLAPGLKTLEDATDIRSRIFFAFEKAERETDPVVREMWQTFVIVGAGPTGVELAGAIGELAHQTLKNDFRAIDSSKSKIILVEAGSRVLSTYPQQLSNKALRSLQRLGVTVRTNTMVTQICDNAVTLQTGQATEKIRAGCTFWAAGVKASELGALLSAATGAKLDRAGRVLVGPDCSIPGHPEIFVIGDLANFAGRDGKPLSGIAPVAMQQGRYVARLIAKRLAGKIAPSFHYRDKGSLAVIGRAAAVADLGRFRFSGIFAWLVWLFVHLLYLVEFENRLLVLVQWAWNYLTKNRGARLITGRIPEKELTSVKLS